jgi:hypothetical protein
MDDIREIGYARMRVVNYRFSNISFQIFLIYYYVIPKSFKNKKIQ